MPKFELYYFSELNKSSDRVAMEGVVDCTGFWPGTRIKKPDAFRMKRLMENAEVEFVRNPAGLNILYQVKLVLFEKENAAKTF